MLVLDRAALLETVLGVLNDPAVQAKVREIVAPSAPLDGALMAPKDYAKHAAISVRSLQYLRDEMIEGVHYQRAGKTGRGVRYRVAAADEFMKARRVNTSTDLSQSIKDDLARRAAKLAG